MKTICFVFIVIFLISFASASYISGDIYIDEHGISVLNIDTDKPLDIDYRTQELTSKLGETWTFNLNLEQYDTILIDVHLPSNLRAIESVQGESSIDINKKIISFIDSKKTIQIKYKLNNKTDYSWLIILIVFILIAIIIYLAIKKKKQNKFDYILPIINDNEKKIVELLMKGNMRQKDIRKKLEFPKASFSRYIINLEKKKLILREGEGKNKIVKLK